MSRISVPPVTFVLILAWSAGVRAQSPRPGVREVLKTGTESVSGVAEPASGRFIAYADDQALKIYSRRTQKTMTVPVRVTPAYGGSLSIARSGRRLVFPVAAEDAKHTPFLWALDLDTLSGAPTGEPHRVGVTPATMGNISPDGRWIAFAAADTSRPMGAQGTRLLVMSSDGGDERMLDSAGRIQTPRWTPDGKTIFYVRGRGRGPALVRVDVAAGRADSLDTTPGVIGVSPDGRYVAFLMGGSLNGFNGFPRAFAKVMDLHGHAVATVRFDGEDRPYGWAAGGTMDLLMFRMSVPATLKTVSLATGSISAFPVTEPYPVGPRFSPDGSRLVMLSRLGDRQQFVVFDLQTKHRRVLATPLEPDSPSGWQWSPDGSRIAFVATNPSTLSQELQVTELATGQTVRLAEVPGRLTESLYRWRSDGKAIDFIQWPVAHVDQGVEVRRVTLAGVQSLVRTLPPVSRNKTWGSQYRLHDDTLALASTPTGQLALPLPQGPPRLLAGHEAYAGLVSPDGKWVAFGSSANHNGYQWAVASTDGKVFRLLGPVMGCDAWPTQWLPDSRAIIGAGENCTDFLDEAFIVPIDGSAATHISLPPNESFRLTPDGKSLLVAATDRHLGSIIAFDLSKVIGAPAGQADKPAKAGTPQKKAAPLSDGFP